MRSTSYRARSALPVASTQWSWLPSTAKVVRTVRPGSPISPRRAPRAGSRPSAPQIRLEGVRHRDGIASSLRACAPRRGCPSWAAADRRARSGREPEDPMPARPSLASLRPKPAGISRSRTALNHHDRRCRDLRNSRLLESFTLSTSGTDGRAGSGRVCWLLSKMTKQRHDVDLMVLATNRPGRSPFTSTPTRPSFLGMSIPCSRAVLSPGTSFSWSLLLL